MNFYDLMLAESIGGSGGGGETSPFTLLNTITVSENVRAVNVDISSYISSYDFILLYEDVTLSSGDWLYYVVNGTEPSGGTYDTTNSKHKGFFAYVMYLPGDSNNKRRGVVNIDKFTQNSNMTSIYIYAYNSSRRIKAGSVFKIYGGNYADM